MFVYRNRAQKGPKYPFLILFRPVRIDVVNFYDKDLAINYHSNEIKVCIGRFYFMFTGYNLSSVQQTKMSHMYTYIYKVLVNNSGNSCHES